MAEEADRIEDLSEDEEASTLAEMVHTVRNRKTEMETWPDGPRPRDPNVRYKRRKIFIDWHLQVNYIGVYLATITLLVIGFIALNYVFAAVYKRALAIQQARPFAEDTNLVLLGTLNVVFVLLLVIGMAVYAIIQSHRVAGPALRFRRAVHAIHSRDYDFHLQLRSKDYMRDIAEQLNGLNNSLKAKDIVISDVILQLESIAKKQPELAPDIAALTANLCDIVLPTRDVEAGEPGTTPAPTRV